MLLLVIFEVRGYLWVPSCNKGTELAAYVAVNPDHLDVVLLVPETHERSRSQHNADHFRTAANLMAHPKLKAGACALTAKSVRQIALAVVNNCARCEDIRSKEEQQKKEAAERADKLAKQKAQEATHRAAQEAANERREADELSNRAAEEARRTKTPPMPDSENDIAYILLLTRRENQASTK